MKIIRIEGCADCPYVIRPPDRSKYFCIKGDRIRQLDLYWDVRPGYVHPDCPLEEEKENE